MFKSNRRSAARLAAAGIVTGLLAAGAMTGAGAATADDNGPTPPAGGATAVYDGIQKDLSDYATVPGANGSVNTREQAGLFKLDLAGGKSVYTYCIDFWNAVEPGAHYQEVPWSATSLYAPDKDKGDAGKITWILQHSFPQVNDLNALAKAADSGPLTQKTAAAGTQVAIWRYSDGIDAKANDAAAEKLAEYLYNSAVVVAEPAPSLSVAPTAVSGKSGDRIGPLTVHVNGASAQATLASDAPAGVKLVDADGAALSKVEDGSKLYLDVPAGTADGSTTVNLTAGTTVPIGRAFTGVGKNSSSQAQILAGSDTTTVTAAATASWAKKGAIPALTAQAVCAKNGVDVTAANQGDEAFTFQLEGKTYTVAPGKSQTVTVPVAEDQKYKIDITMPDKSVKTFEGVLDCKTAVPSPTTPANQPSPATSGGTSGGSGDNLAETGSSNATPVIAGVAIALVVIGGGATFFFRRRKNTAASE